MLIRDAKVKAAMQRLADSVRNDTLEIVAKHFEAIGERSPEPDAYFWRLAAREVRELATRAEFNAITERIQP